TGAGEDLPGPGRPREIPRRAVQRAAQLQPGLPRDRLRLDGPMAAGRARSAAPRRSARASREARGARDLDARAQAAGELGRRRRAEEAAAGARRVAAQLAPSEG